MAEPYPWVLVPMRLKAPLVRADASEVLDPPTATGRSGHPRLARERFIWRFRAAAASFVAVQNLIEPGDDATLSWAIFAAFSASVVATGLALAGDPRPRRVTAVGWIAMACDVAVVAAIMANNLTDPAEPIYLIGVLAMLEATMRWRRWGGIAGGVAAGLAAGAGRSRSPPVPSASRTTTTRRCAPG
jgi:hypothetical protein